MKKLIIIIAILITLSTMGALFTRPTQRETDSPPLVFLPPKTNIISPSGASYSFLSRQSYSAELPVYNTTDAPSSEIENAVLTIFPIFKTATFSSLLRDDVLTKTWALPTRNLTITHQNQSTILTTHEQGGASSVLVSPLTAIKNIFSSLEISQIISLIEEAQETDPIEGLLILDPLVTSVIGRTYSYKINGLRLFTPSNPGSVASSITDNLGVLRALYLLIPPKILIVEKNEPVLTQEEIIQNLLAGRGVIVTGRNPETENLSGDLTFSTFKIDRLEIVYTRITSATLAPAFLLHGYGSNTNGKTQEATLFLWATRYQPTPESSQAL